MYARNECTVNLSVDSGKTAFVVVLLTVLLSTTTRGAGLVASVVNNEECDAEKRG